MKKESGCSWGGDINILLETEVDTVCLSLIKPHYVITNISFKNMIICGTMSKATSNIATVLISIIIKDSPLI